MSELADAVLAAEQKMGALIEESSLGTAGARQLRRRVSSETANKVVAHAEAAPDPADTRARPRASVMADGSMVMSSDAVDVFARLGTSAFHELVASSMAGDREGGRDFVHLDLPGHRPLLPVQDRQKRLGVLDRGRRGSGGLHGCPWLSQPVWRRARVVPPVHVRRRGT